MTMKKIFCFLLSLAMLLEPLAARAVNLDNAFSNLMGNASYNVSSPGRFKSGVLNGYSAGGIDVKFPRQANMPQLFSFTPPTISVGCNGISAHFGGFSFISGKEFDTLLKSIASGAAMGFVTELVMKTLCPSCQSVVDELKTAAQYAAKMTKDSCQWGKDAADKFLAGTGHPDGISLCSKTAADQGSSADAMSAYDSVCSTMGDALKTLHDFNQSHTGTGSGSSTGSGSNGEIPCQAGAGNITWQMLTAMDASGATESNAQANYHRKLIIMNILGANMGPAETGKTVSCADSSGQTIWSAVESSPNFFCAPRIDPAMLADYFLCGGSPTTSSTSVSGAVQSYCSNAYSQAQASSMASGPAPMAQILHCKGDSGVTDYSQVDCNNLQLGDVTSVFTGQGFLVHTNELLREAALRVAAGTPFTDAKGQEIIALIQTQPYPLYQAINAAAVYPSATDDLLDSMSVLIAEQMVYHYLDDLLRMQGRGQKGTCLVPAQVKEVFTFMENIRTINKERHKTIANNYTIQQAITEQIRQLNITIQRQYLTPDLVGSSQLANEFTRAVNTSLSSQKK